MARGRDDDPGLAGIKQLIEGLDIFPDSPGRSPYRVKELRAVFDQRSIKVHKNRRISGAMAQPVVQRTPIQIITTRFGDEAMIVQDHGVDDVGEIKIALGLERLVIL